MGGYPMLKLNLTLLEQFLRSPVTYILVGRIGKLIDDTNQIAVPSKLFLQNISGRDVRGEATGTFNLNSIVENSDMNVVGDSVVAMQHSIRDYLMQCFLRIGNRFQSPGSQDLNPADCQVAFRRRRPRSTPACRKYGQTAIAHLKNFRPSQIRSTV
jgi:hypothetical protein